MSEYPKHPEIRALRDWEYTSALKPRSKPQPGEVCPVCDRRVNKPRKPSSPDARKLKAGILPNDTADNAEELIDALQHYADADHKSYPRGEVVLAALVIASQQREEVRAWLRRHGGFS